MTREQIAAKIAEQTAKKGQTEKKNYLWKPPVGKAYVRLVPSKYKREDLFTELLVHFEVGKTMLSLSNFGEQDPIEGFIQELKKTPDWKSAYKLEPKKRIFVPIIVRGEETKGVQLWEFGKNTFLDILRLMDDEDLGDITDPMKGHDIVVDTTSPEQNGTNYNSSSVKIKTKSTTLSDDAKKIQEWLETQPNPVDRYPRLSYEEMKDVLAKYLSPETAAKREEGSEKKDTTGDLPWESKEPKKYTLSKEADEKSKEIDKLFKI